MDKYKVFNKFTKCFTEEISQDYQNQMGFKGQVYSRTTYSGKDFYANTSSFGRTFKSFKSADKFMKEKGYMPKTEK